MTPLIVFEVPKIVFLTLNQFHYTMCFLKMYLFHKENEITFYILSEIKVLKTRQYKISYISDSFPLPTRPKKMRY